MNITVVTTEGFGKPYICQTLLDYISGKTLIITRNYETQQSWRLQIIAFNSVKDKRNRTKLENVFSEFKFLNGYGINPEAYEISSDYYDNIILDDVWMVYQATVVSYWLSKVKTINPQVNFFGISEVIGDSYKIRIDQRISDIETVFASRLKSTLEEKTKNTESNNPQHVIHVIKNNMLSDKTIHSILFSSSGKHPSLTTPVDIEKFSQDIFEPQDKGISSFSTISKCISQLYKSMDMLSTIMVFDPSSKKGRAMSLLSTQLNGLLFSLDRRNLLNDKLLGDMQVSISNQKNIIFCDIKQSDFLRQYINWYVKRKFGDETIKFAIRNFLYKGSSTLCIEDHAYDPTEEILHDCNNVILFGSNKYDKSLISDIHAKAKGDLNILTFVTPETADESNVLHAINGLEDNSLTILTHDLSS